MTIIDPCDAADIRQSVAAMTAHPGLVYSRLLRGRVPAVLSRRKPDHRFRIGEMQLIREGRDTLVISSGFMTMRAGRRRGATSACSTARRSSRSTQTILHEAGKAGRLVIAAENHTVDR